MATGYYIEESKEWLDSLPDNDIVKRFGRTRMVHWPLLDGPIEYYEKSPYYTVTPFEVPDEVQT